MKDDPLNKTEDGKQNAYFSSLVNAFIETSLIKDKSLLTLSAGGIGLIITLLTTVGFNSKFEAFLYSVAILSFLTVIFLILKIFTLNSEYIKAILNEEEYYEKRLKKYDRSIKTVFIIGVLAFLSIGINSSINKLGGSMSNQKSTTKTTQKKSLQGLQSLKPNKTGGNTGQGSSGKDTSASDSTGKSEK